MTYEERVARREEEIASLKKARLSKNKGNQITMSKQQLLTYNC